jgi:hypothetical protein
MKCTVFLNVTPFCLEDMCEDSEEHAVCVTRRGEQHSFLPSTCRLEISQKPGRIPSELRVLTPKKTVDRMVLHYFKETFKLLSNDTWELILPR